MRKPNWIRNVGSVKVLAVITVVFLAAAVFGAAGSSLAQAGGQETEALRIDRHPGRVLVLPRTATDSRRSPGDAGSSERRERGPRVHGRARCGGRRFQAGSVRGIST